MTSQKLYYIRHLTPTGEKTDEFSSENDWIKALTDLGVSVDQIPSNFNSKNVIEWWIQDPLWEENGEAEL